MKRVIVLMISILMINAVAKAGVCDSIGVKKVKGQKCIVHKVTKGETWYSVSRKYKMNVMELQSQNPDTKESLKIGEILLVPIGPIIVDNTSSAENIVYHKIEKGETLTILAQKFEVSADDLREWNHLKSDQINAGAKIIVAMNNKTKKEDHVIAHRDISLKKDSTVYVVKASDKKEITEKQLGDPKIVFAKGRKEITEHGIASWIEDEDINPNKYYGLHRTAPIGTIIHVTNKMNSKSVFVKVVGVLPDTGDNANIIIKISKATANKLDVIDARFQCELRYGISEK